MSIGNNPSQILGIPDPVCNQGTYVSTPAYNQSVVNFSQSANQQSDTGVIDILNGRLKLTTDSPAWLTTVISVSNAVNTVAFDCDFESPSGAQGLLTVYWDTNVLGSVDERVVQPGPQHYTLPFPAAASGIHTLGFRLDPFSDVHSTAVITNVVTEYVGVSQPFSLSVTTNTLAGMLVFQLTGQSGFTYTVQGSPDLVTWTNIATLVNTNGTVQFFDQNSPGFGHRFYRAVAPY